jgi:catechol 2,3-dioxygenase-like lactoylglutathione lyase family enzyme
MKRAAIVTLICIALPCAAAPAPDNDIGILARIHFATHTPDFDRARAFYRAIGYTTGMGGFPLTNTHQMARSLGMYDICQYELVKGEVISLPTSSNVANIDLLQFKTPFNGEAPYELPNHLGMAYAALLTTDLLSDVAFLKTLGATFLSEPYGSPGDQFVFFRDPDGVLYKLMETELPHGDPNADMHLTAMPYIGINVTDLDASLEFYRAFGYTSVTPLQQTTGSIDESRAWGLNQPFQIKGVDVALAGGDGHVLRLVQWIDPFDADPAYPPPINHIGISRIALMVPNLDQAYATLEAQGVEFLSDPAPCCSGTGADRSGIVNAIDPDGVYLEHMTDMIDNAARGAALATGTEVEIDRYGEFRDGITVGSAEELFFEYAKQFGAGRINEEHSRPAGFEETGRLSHDVPGIGVSVFSSRETYHTHGMLEDALGPVGHEGFEIAAKIMAAFLYDYLTDQSLRDAISHEHAVLKSLLGDYEARLREAYADEIR